MFAGGAGGIGIVLAGGVAGVVGGGAGVTGACVVVAGAVVPPFVLVVVVPGVVYVGAV